jgi:hypothetical protein
LIVGEEDEGGKIEVRAKAAGHNPFRIEFYDSHTQGSSVTRNLGLEDTIPLGLPNTILATLNLPRKKGPIGPQGCD